MSREIEIKTEQLDKLGFTKISIPVLGKNMMVEYKEEIYIFSFFKNDIGRTAKEIEKKKILLPENTGKCRCGDFSGMLGGSAGAKAQDYHRRQYPENKVSTVSRANTMKKFLRLGHIF